MVEARDKDVPFHISVFAPRWLTGEAKVDTYTKDSYQNLLDTPYLYYRPPRHSTAQTEGGSPSESDAEETQNDAELDDPIPSICYIL